MNILSNHNLWTAADEVYQMNVPKARGTNHRQQVRNYTCEIGFEQGYATKDQVVSKQNYPADSKPIEKRRRLN